MASSNPESVFKMEISPEIRVYYETAPEHERLFTGPFQLEFERTKELLLERLREPPATILDVGGGPGVYALWLAQLGYEVHLIDPVASLVAHALRRSQTAERPIKSCMIGDARAIEWKSNSADVVLQLGPLYHLIERAHRLQALREARRVLVAGGRVFAAGISRFASALDGISRDLFASEAFQAIVKRDLSEGVHRNDTDRLEYFTTAKFHQPEELRMELIEAGFANIEILGVEGPGWLFADFEERWKDERRRNDLLMVARAFEREVSVQGVSAHLLAVGEKQ
jgi:ubiquinone/menaquinone biosynthesis C-methylase UbiE